MPSNRANCRAEQSIFNADAVSARFGRIAATILIALTCSLVFSQRAAGSTGKATLYFEENRGQWPEGIQYVQRSARGAVGVTRDGAWFARGDGSSPIRFRLVGSSADARVTAEEPLELRTHSFIGSDPDRWVTDIPACRRVVVREAYPGIDLVFRGRELLEYDFILHPGADPRSIRFRFDREPGAEITPDGDLVIGRGANALRMKIPFAYQDVEGRRTPVAAGYRIRGDEISFDLGAYDSSQTLVIDPVVVGYSTFLGGLGSEVTAAIAVDADQNVYLFGSTSSVDFPVPPGSAPRSGGGPNDSFVAKLSPQGTELSFVTFLGGSADEGNLTRDVAVDATGAVYVASVTSSTDFPTTAGAPQGSYAGGNRDGFIAKLGSDGALLASTYLGGSDLDRLDGMTIDASGNVYVTGFTSSPDFPLTETAFQRDRRGSTDSFVTKIRTQPFEIVYSTLLGGGQADHARKIAVDSTGAVWIAGNTFSADHPITEGVVQPHFAGAGSGSTFRGDGFVTKLDPSGGQILWSTFLGGSNGELVDSMAVDREGTVYVSGLTYSTDFPVTPSAVRGALSGQADGFVARISADGRTLLFGTYLGGLTGFGTDEAWAVAVDPEGRVLVGGGTSSYDFPVSRYAFQRSMSTSHAGFFAVLEPDGSKFVHSSYLGGSTKQQNVFAVATDDAGNFYLTGSTQSADFPTSDGALQSVKSAAEDVFIFKFTLESPPSPGRVRAVTRPSSDGGP